MDAAVCAKRASLVAILTACTAFSVGMGLTLPLLSLVLERRGVPGSINGLNLATAGLAAILVTPYVPRLLARFGTAQYQAACLVTAAAAMIALYEIRPLWLWFPTRFCLSVALNGLFVISEFWISQLADETNRGRYVALYSTCYAAGFGLGPAILALIGTRGVAPFACGAGLMLLALIPILIVRDAAPRPEDTAPTPFLTVLGSAPAAFFPALVYGAIDAGLAGLVPVYAVRSGYSEVRAALAVTALGIGSLAFQYPLGHLADRTERRRVMGLCVSAGLAGAIAAPFAVRYPPAFYLLLFLWGGITLGIYTIGLIMLGERFKGVGLASANAGNVIAYSLGLLVGPSIEGASLDLWNPNGLMVALALIAAAYLVVLLLPGFAKRRAGYS